MAKREGKPAAIRQQRIPGSIDVPSEEVLRKGEEYVTTLQLRMRTQAEENALRAELIDVMKGYGIQEFGLDGYQVTLAHSEKDRITVKKLGEADEADG